MYVLTGERMDERVGQLYRAGRFLGPTPIYMYA